MLTTFKNYLLPYLVLFLMTIGVITIYSVSSLKSNSAIIITNDKLYAQLTAIFISLSVGLFIIVCTSINHWKQYIGLLMWIFCVFTLLILDFSGQYINGAKRWFTIPGVNMRVQPAEFAKLALAIVLVAIATAKESVLQFNVEKDWSRFCLMCVVTIITATVIYFTVDLGSTLIAISIFVMVVWFSPKFKHGYKIGLCLACIGILWGLVTYYKNTDLDNYRAKRVAYASQDKNGYGWQATNSEGAWSGSSLISGSGLGNTKYRKFTNYTNDYILANIAEHFGFLSIFGIILIYILIFYRCTIIAKGTEKQQEKDEAQFSIVLCWVIPSIIITEVSIHAITNLGIFPFKGLTLPFVSYGGSSMLMCTMALALIVRVDNESYANTYNSNEKKKIKNR